MPHSPIAPISIGEPIRHRSPAGTVSRSSWINPEVSTPCILARSVLNTIFIKDNSTQLILYVLKGSGLKSKVSYMYGSVSMQIKLVPGNSAGTVTTFYLSSSGPGHDEIDFEFLGNVSGQPYTIHTNIFTKGAGQREQQFKALWFNPTDGYHNYTIQWTPYSVVVSNPLVFFFFFFRWLVDSVPIRVFRNFHDSEINFPDSQPMNVYASLWNADDWATQGGRVKTDWLLAPFVANFQTYNPNSCYCPEQNSVWKCSSYNSANWWTDSSKYYQLTETQYYQMKWIRDNYMIYDYCPAAMAVGKFPKECSLNQN
ncbi:putative xyloglucan endotransglucosylase/hydrolase protein 26 [Silene latifolia]|uniref:putative xyloglucan endotransglucosylase/hydrolase protein 26 n=1 Tax=Silene latifolia TaxID=37657 RepID=UPI003D773AF7